MSTWLRTTYSTMVWYYFSLNFNITSLSLGKCNSLLQFCRYHVPRSWLKPTKNLMVVFEELGGNPWRISLVKRIIHTPRTSESNLMTNTTRVWDAKWRSPIDRTTYKRVIFMKNKKNAGVEFLYSFYCHYTKVVWPSSFLIYSLNLSVNLFTWKRENYKIQKC